MAEFNINTGLSHVNIKNEDGTEVGSFSFLASDPAILGRAEKIVDFFNNLTFPDLSNTEQRTEFCDRITDELTIFLGTDASSTFKNISPIALMDNGNFYFESIIEYVCDEIQNVHKSRLEKKLKKVHAAVAAFNGE